MFIGRQLAIGCSSQGFGQSTSGVLHVKGREYLCIAAIAREDRIDDRVEFGNSGFCATWLGERSAAKQLDPVVQSAKYLTKNLITAGLNQFRVECVLVVAHASDVSTFKRGLERPNGLCQPRMILDAALLRHNSASQTFQPGAYLKQLQGIFQRGFGHNHSAIGNCNNQAFGFDLAERLAQKRARYGKFLTKLTLDKARSRAQIAICDSATQSFFNLRAQWCSDPNNFYIDIHLVNLSDSLTNCY